MGTCARKRIKWAVRLEKCGRAVSDGVVRSGTASLSKELIHDLISGWRERTRLSNIWTSVSRQMEAQCPSGRNRLGMNKPKKQALWSPVMDMKERVIKDEAGEAVRSQIPELSGLWRGLCFIGACDLNYILMGWLSTIFSRSRSLAMRRREQSTRTERRAVGLK